MIAVITSLFNPIGYETRKQNFLKFREQFSPGVLHVVEASFDGEFVSDGMKVVAGPQNIMWQKERMLNLAVESLPAKYDKIVWVDADILFSNSGWLQDTEKMLSQHLVVQCFTRARVRTHRKGGRTANYHAAGLGKKPIQPGMAWAARREYFPLYDRAIVGGGDRLNLWTLNSQPLRNSQWMKHWNQWRKERFPNGVDWGTVPGTVRHLWHGSHPNRKYAQRYEILREFQYDPRTDIELDTNGLWKWSGNKPELEEAVAEYFKGRKEDSEQ